MSFAHLRLEQCSHCGLYLELAPGQRIGACGEETGEHVILFWTPPRMTKLTKLARPKEEHEGGAS